MFKKKELHALLKALLGELVTTMLDPSTPQEVQYYVNRLYGEHKNRIKDIECMKLLTACTPVCYSGTVTLKGKQPKGAIDVSIGE